MLSKGVWEPGPLEVVVICVEKPGQWSSVACVTLLLTRVELDRTFPFSVLDSVNMLCGMTGGSFHVDCSQWESYVGRIYGLFSTFLCLDLE